MDGVVKVVQNEFSWPLVHPAWSRDSNWLVFHAYPRRGLWVCDTRQLVLHFVPFQKNPPSPLLDVTGIVE